MARLLLENTPVTWVAGVFHFIVVDRSAINRFVPLRWTRSNMNIPAMLNTPLRFLGCGHGLCCSRQSSYAG